MKVIRRGYEKEIICTKCKSLLYYVNEDVHKVRDDEGNYKHYVKCPVCGEMIKVL